MAPMAAGLSEQDMQDLGAYLRASHLPQHQLRHQQAIQQLQQPLRQQLLLVMQQQVNTYTKTATSLVQSVLVLAVTVKTAKAKY